MPTMKIKYELPHEKNLSLGYLTMSHTNWAVQLTKIARGLNFGFRE